MAALQFGERLKRDDAGGEAAAAHQVDFESRRFVNALHRPLVVAAGTIRVRSVCE